LGFFADRPRYIDVILGLIAVGLIAARTARSRMIWRQLPLAAREPRAARRAAWRSMIGFTALVAVVFMLMGAVLAYSSDGWPGVARRLGNWHLLVACALYFPWALLQQFVFQFYLLGRLLVLVPYGFAVPAAAVAFSMVHFPRVPVMAATMLGGVIWAVTYARYRTLWPLAASHAILGSTLHYWVFGRDLARLWGAA
jgi:hypothetical protein